MKTLKLTVNKTWFQMIKTGFKKEEYREKKDYWFTRLCNKDALVNGDIVFKHFDFVEFTNGYSKTSPQITMEFKGTRIANDYNMDMGGHLMCDEEGYKEHCFIISLGNEVSRLNC
jgi:hypothetical protein